MDLSSLPKITNKAKKRMGRGFGSGRGKTAGRGTKGQKARNKVRIWYGGEPMGSSWIKRLSMLPGKGRNKPKSKKPILVKVSALNVFRKGSVVDLKKLQEEGIGKTKKAERRERKVKIVAGGKLKKALKIKASTSKGAKRMIGEAGGEVVV